MMFSRQVYLAFDIDQGNNNNLTLETFTRDDDNDTWCGTNPNLRGFVKNSTAYDELANFAAMFGVTIGGICSSTFINFPVCEFVFFFQHSGRIVTVWTILTSIVGQHQTANIFQSATA